MDETRVCLSVCVSVCIFLASDSLETSNLVILVKLGMVTASESVIHDNASRDNYIDLDLHSRSQILILNKCSIISETKHRGRTLIDWLLSLHWVASLCPLYTIWLD